MDSGAVRAFVLAAGRGERLGPLTEATPKPLLPVLGVPVVEHTLRTLAAAGVDQTALNLFHLGDQIRERLGSEVAGMPLIYRPERELLGTLGPLGGLGDFFGGSGPALLVNGDSLCNWPVGALMRAHRASGAQATLLLSASADVDSFGGGVRVDERGRIFSFRGGNGAPPFEGEPGRRGVFAGFHAIAPALLRGVEAKPSDIVRDLYEPALAAGARIQGVFTSRPWHDLGTPRRYLEGVLDRAGAGRGRDGVWRHPSAEVGEAEIVRSVLEEGSVIRDGALVEGSLLMPDAVVGVRARVTRTIVGPGVEVPEDTVIGDRLLTRGDRGIDSTSIRRDQT